jgi:Ca2+-transporting ATPase
MLLGAAGVSVITGGWADAAAILSVVLINAILGYITESHSEQAIAALLERPQPSVPVIRDGARRRRSAEDIVPGDLLLLRHGTYVAADARLLSTERLTIDEASLTGESMPVSKSPTQLCQETLPLRDRRNMIYRGTVVTGGSGSALAVATGNTTEMARIHRLVETARPPETPVQRQLGELGTALGLVCGVVSGLVFGVGLLRRYAPLEMAKSAIALAVAAVPEGLPMVATTTLALGVKRMRRLRVHVRRLDAVETLGSVQVFCLDKTGTLTENRMRVMRVFTGMESFDVDNSGFHSDGRAADFASREDLQWLTTVSVLCSETGLQKNNGRWQLNGSPTETSLVQMAMDAGIDPKEVRRRHPLLSTEYRTETRGFMTTLHRDGSTRLLAMKGRPSDVVRRCRLFRRNGQVLELTDSDRQRIEIENQRMAGDALRVLGFAYRHCDAEGSAEEGDFIWLGLAGIADPIRPHMRELMQVFHRAGIRTVMITGDQSATAHAVGRALDLADGERIELLDSTQLDGVDPQLLGALGRRVHVFSAVSPSHKLQIVQALQRHGLVVAMTGDGINDGPALKAADIGVAMGNGGTEVAGMVSDVVLQDDNLQTMIVAIRQGRGIYDNTRNAIHYLLATNASEIFVTLTAVAAGFGNPLTPLQLLWINLVTDVFPVLALATQTPEEDTMRRPPRDPREPLLARRDFCRISRQAAVISGGTLATYGWAIARYGFSPRANTMAFTSLTAAQILHMLSASSPNRSFFSGSRPLRNRAIASALVGGLALQLVAFLVPPLRRILGSVRISPMDVGVSLLGASVPFLINELFKTRAGRQAAPKLPGRALNQSVAATQQPATQQPALPPVAQRASGDGRDAVEQATVMSPMTVRDLRRQAKQRGLHGYSRLRKAELVAMLENA